MSEYNYDIVVLGAGPGGYEAAIRCAQYGKNTALVEARDLGGTCLNRGCIPTKALLHGAEVYQSALNAASCGVTTGEVGFDFAKLAEYKDSVVAGLRKGIAGLEKAHGVKVISAMENIGEGDESVLLEAMLEASAEYYSLDLKKKIARGMRESALKGKFVGGAVLWWCSINAEHKLIVIDERAAIVKEAFTRYDSGEGSKSIIDDFVKRGLRSNRGMPVTLSWLLSILKNRKTIGEYTYNGIDIPGGLPAVVDKALFDRVQERIARKRRTGGGEATSKTEYLLQGKLFCRIARQRTS